MFKIYVNNDWWSRRTRMCTTKTKRQPQDPFHIQLDCCFLLGNFQSMSTNFKRTNSIKREKITSPKNNIDGLTFRSTTCWMCVWMGYKRKRLSIFESLTWIEKCGVYLYVRSTRQSLRLWAKRISGHIKDRHFSVIRVL